MPPPLPPPSSVTSPAFTIATIGLYVTIPFQGVNLHTGDRAKWVSANATSCASNFDATAATHVSFDVNRGEHMARFFFGDAHFGSRAGTLVLCYRFGFAATAGRLPPTAFILFPAIRLALLRYDQVSLC